MVKCFLIQGKHSVPSNMMGGRCGELQWKHPVPGKGHVYMSGCTFTAIKVGNLGCLLSVTVKLSYTREVGASCGYFSVTSLQFAPERGLLGTLGFMVKAPASETRESTLSHKQGHNPGCSQELRAGQVVKQ